MCSDLCKIHISKIREFVVHRSIVCRHPPYSVGAVTETRSLWRDTHLPRAGFDAFEYGTSGLFIEVKMSFKEMNLPEYVLGALDKLNITTPTEIQRRTIPMIQQGLDVIGKSKTGSGKTFAYGIPAIDMIDTDNKATQVLVVCPTRELTMQVTDELRKLSESKEGCRAVPVFGGASMDRQIQSLKKGARIVVGTPGRLMDHIARRTLRLKNIKLLVLDEADEMLNMGFREDIEKILESVNPYRQTVMFSATMPEPILAITKNYMKNPTLIEVDQGGTNRAIDQFYLNVGLKEKGKALIELFKTLKPALSITFCNTKKMVDNLTKTLVEAGIPALALHGDMRQSERTKVMRAVKGGDSGVLVATDVAARGIDINGVDVVFNYDLPVNHDFYVHRIGRTGRAGKVGKAYTLLNTKYQVSAFAETMKQTGNVAKEYYCSFTHLSEFKLPGIRPEKRDKFAAMKKGASAPVEKAKRLVKTSLEKERDFIENAGKYRDSGKNHRRRNDNKNVRVKTEQRDRPRGYFPTEYNPRSRHGKDTIIKKKKGTTVHYLDRDPLED